MIIIPASDSDLGMTQAEMISEVEDQLRDTHVDTQILRWLNMTMFFLGGTNEYPFFYSSSSFLTVAGLRNYVLNRDMHRLKLVYMPGILQTLTAATAIEVAQSFPDFSTIQGRPTRYMLNGRSMDLFRVPDGAYTVNYDYYRRPKKLINPTDVSDFPYEWHPLIVQGAIVRGFKYEDNPNYSTAKAEYNEMLAILMATMRSRPDFRHRMASEDKVGRLPKPILPPNRYPSPSSGY